MGSDTITYFTGPSIKALESPGSFMVFKDMLLKYEDSRFLGF